MFNELMFNELVIHLLLYPHSSYSTLAALNIAHFGCGISLRSDGWMRGIITRICWECKIVEDYS